MPPEDYVIDSSGDDSIWNFHVWNEAWFSRPDMFRYDAFYGQAGFQVLDTTPQEVSKNKLSCCGPTPVSLIKRRGVRVTRKVYNGLKIDKRAHPYRRWVRSLREHYPTAKISAGRYPQTPPGYGTDFVKDLCQYFVPTNEENLGLRYVSTTVYTDATNNTEDRLDITTTYI